MDPKSQAKLDQLLKTDPIEFNEADKAFLRARRDYLKQSQKEEYKSILEVQTSVNTETATVKHGTKKS